MPPAALPSTSSGVLRAAAVCWATGALTYVALEGVAASAFVDHSYATHWISDLAIPYPTVTDGRAVDSPWHAAMTAGFVVHGLLFALAGALLRHAHRSAWSTTAAVAAGLHGLGMVLLAVFPSGPRAEADGTIALHATGALLAIVGGNVAVAAAGVALHRAGVRLVAAGPWLAVSGVAAFVWLLVDGSLTPDRLVPAGVSERVAVYTVTLWQLLAAAAVLLLPRRPRPAPR